MSSCACFVRAAPNAHSKPIIHFLRMLSLSSYRIHATIPHISVNVILIAFVGINNDGVAGGKWREGQADEIAIYFELLN